MSVVAVILAGGASTRFRGDKLAAELDGRPLLHHALEACAAVVPALVVVLAPEAPTPDLPPALAKRVVVAHDRSAHQGPLAGLATGLGAVSMTGPEADLALLVGGDMPALVPGVLRLLVRRLEEPAPAGDLRPEAVTLEAEPPASLPMAVRIATAVPAVRELLGANRRSLQALLDRVSAAHVDAAVWRALDPDGRTIADIDTPDDLVAASRRGS